MEKINYRQLSILVFLSIIATKLLVLPSVLFYYSKNNAYIASFIVIVVNVLFLAIILQMLKHSGDKNIYEFIKSRLGSFMARFICFLFALYFLFETADIIKSMNLFLLFNLYYKLKWTYFALPLIAIVGFMVYKGIRNIGRTAEMTFILVLGGLIFLGIKAVIIANFDNLLPFMQGGFQPILTTIYKSTSWFGSGIVLFLFFGNVDLKTKNNWTMWKYILIGASLIQAFIMLFIAIFPNTATTHRFALSDISQMAARSGLAELQWLIVVIWLMAQLIQISVFVYCCSRSIKYTFGFKNNTIPIFIVLALLITWIYFGNNNIQLADIFLSDYMIIPMMVVQYFIPILLAISDLIYMKKGAKNAKKISIYS